MPLAPDPSTNSLLASMPPAVNVTAFGTTAGWKVEQQKDAQGRITGAVWSGGSIPFAEYAEFSFEAKNPATPMKLEWKVIQIYEEGTRSEWTGPEGSRTPSSVTTING